MPSFFSLHRHQIPRDCRSHQQRCLGPGHRQSGRGRWGGVRLLPAAGASRRATHPQPEKRGYRAVLRRGGGTGPSGHHAVGVRAGEGPLQAGSRLWGHLLPPPWESEKTLSFSAITLYGLVCSGNRLSAHLPHCPYLWGWAQVSPAPPWSQGGPPLPPPGSALKPGRAGLNTASQPTSLASPCSSSLAACDIQHLTGAPWVVCHCL